MSIFEQAGLSDAGIPERATREAREVAKTEYIDFLRSVKQAFAAIEAQTQKADKLIRRANYTTDYDVDMPFTQPSEEERGQADVLRSEAAAIRATLPDLTRQAEKLLGELSKKIDAMLNAGFKIDKDAHLGSVREQ